MKKINEFIKTILLSFSITILSSCGSLNSSNSLNHPSSSDKPLEIIVPSNSDMFTETDKNASYDIMDSNTIFLSGSSANVSSSSITVSNNLITINAEGTYMIKGNSTNQSIIVNTANEKVKLVLSDVTMINDNFAALYIKNADKVFIILEGNNTLSVMNDFVTIDENSVDGTIFAKDDITIQGDGNLILNSSKHGIVGKDDIKITGGTITISAVSHGIQANDSVRISDANLNINAGKDGIQVENTDDETKGYVYFESGFAEIIAGYDGIDASSTVQITNGVLNITSGGGSNKTVSSTNSTKGIKAQKDILITDGSITIDSSDDSIHSNGSIEITGGIFTLSSNDDGIHADSSLIISNGSITITKSYEGLEAQNVNISGGKIAIKASDDGINAAGGNDNSSIGGRPGQNSFNTNINAFITISGGEIYVNSEGDGIDSNGNLTISGGLTIVEGPTNNGNGALDYDGTGTVTGGTLIAIGSSGMAMNFSSATQGSILLNINSQKAGTTISLNDSNGNEILSMTATKAYSSVLITSESLIQGNSYNITAGSSTNTVILTTLIYGKGSSMGGGQPGGRW